MHERLPLRFFVVTFAWSWLIWAPLALVGLGVLHVDDGLWSIIATPIAYLGAFGPAVGACYSVWTLNGRKALVAFLKSFLSLRFGWKIWAAIFGILAAVNIVAWYVPELLGHDRLSMLLPSALVFPAWWLLMVLVGGGQEEIGWRGYILEPMEARFGVWAGNIALGLVWTVWHVPLFFVPGTSQTFMPFAAFAIGLIGESFFFSWVMKVAEGKPLSAVIAHGTANALIPLFPTLAMEADAAQPRWWLHQSLLLVVGALLLLSYVRSGARRGKDLSAIEIRLRIADATDRDVVFGLLESAAAWLRERGIDYWQSWLDPPNHHVQWVDDGLSAGEFRLIEGPAGVLGCVRLQDADPLFWSDVQDPAGYVHSLTIDRRFAGQGLGARVVEAIDSELAARGVGLLRLDCGETSTGLRDYYESLGFRAVGTTVVDGESLVLYERLTGQ